MSAETDRTKSAERKDVYGVGVVGCGAVWQRHRLAFEHSDRLRCATVFDPDTDRAREAATRTGARVARNAEEVLTDPEVDIAAILTPVFTHADQVEIGAAAGKHFMLEKPMATTLTDGERIVSAIRRAGVECFHPTLRALASDLFAKLRELTTEDGLLGPVRCAFYHLVGAPVTDSPWMKDREMCFPPAEYDPHVMDTFFALTGAACTSVWCHAGRHARHQFNQDDVTTIVATFDGGQFLQTNVNWVVDRTWCGSTVSFDIACERGMIRHNWFDAKWFADGQSGSFTSVRRETQGNRWDHYHTLIDAIEGGPKCSPNEEDGLRYVRIFDAALRSSRNGETVCLDAKAAEAEQTSGRSGDLRHP